MPRLIEQMLTLLLVHKRSYTVEPHYCKGLSYHWTSKQWTYLQTWDRSLILIQLEILSWNSPLRAGSLPREREREINISWTRSGILVQRLTGWPSLRKWPPGEVKLFGKESMIFRTALLIVTSKLWQLIQNIPRNFYNTEIWDVLQDIYQDCFTAARWCGYKSCEELRLEMQPEILKNENFRLEERFIRNAPSAIIEGYNRDQFTNAVETGKVITEAASKTLIAALYLRSPSQILESDLVIFWTLKLTLQEGLSLIVLFNCAFP